MSYFAWTDKQPHCFFLCSLSVFSLPANKICCDQIITSCFTSVCVLWQWSCFRSPASTSKERNSSTTEPRSSTRTSRPRRKAWWETLLKYPTLIWKVPVSFWRGLWWVKVNEIWGTEAGNPGEALLLLRHRLFAVVSDYCPPRDLFTHLWLNKPASIFGEELIILTVQKEFHLVSCAVFNRSSAHKHPTKGSQQLPVTL